MDVSGQLHAPAVLFIFTKQPNYNKSRSSVLWRLVVLW